MDELINAVVMQGAEIVIAAVVALVGALAARVLGVKLSEATEDRIRVAGILAASFAEEKARALVKAGLGELSGAMKEKIAVERLLEKIPNVDEEEARRVIQSVLPGVRASFGQGAAELGKAIRTPERPAPGVDAATSVTAGI